MAGSDVYNLRDATLSMERSRRMSPTPVNTQRSRASVYGTRAYAWPSPPGATRCNCVRAMFCLPDATQLTALHHTMTRRDLPCNWARRAPQYRARARLLRVLHPRAAALLPDPRDYARVAHGLGCIRRS